MKNKLVVLLCVVASLLVSAAEQGDVSILKGEKHFLEVIASKEKLVIVDFFAVWCPSCSEVIKSLKTVHSKVDDKVILVKIDFSKHLDFAKKHGVTSVPTVMFYKGGKLLYKLESLCSTRDYQTVVDSLLATGKVPDHFVPEGHKKSMGISAVQARDLIEKSGAVVLDVRSGYEYRNGHLENAIHIPVNSIESRVNELSEHKSKNIVVYCLSGYRSSIACKVLAKKGYKVFNMARGVLDWNQSGYKLVR